MGPRTPNGLKDAGMILQEGGTHLLEICFSYMFDRYYEGEAKHNNEGEDTTREGKTPNRQREKKEKKLPTYPKCQSPP